jgi:hypothetical protein
MLIDATAAAALRLLSHRDKGRSGQIMQLTLRSSSLGTNPQRFALPRMATKPEAKQKHQADNR